MLVVTSFVLLPFAAEEATVFRIEGCSVAFGKGGVGFVPGVSSVTVDDVMAETAEADGAGREREWFIVVAGGAKGALLFVGLVAAFRSLT